MGIRDLLHETLFSLSANKARSFLTILGIVIGIASVIAMTSLIGGMQNMFYDEMGLYQARMVQIGVFAERPLTSADTKALGIAFPEYEQIDASAGYPVSLSTSKKKYETTAMGVTGNFSEMVGIKVSQGRNINEDDNLRKSRVLVLGKGVIRELFGDEEAQVLGSTIRVAANNESYIIVGIIDGNGTSAYFNGCYMPVSTLHSRITGGEFYDGVFALAKEGTDVIELSQRTREFFMQRFKLDEGGVFVYSMQEVMDQVNVIMAGFSMMLTAIASISLFVGGIGIMNMMLTTVTERTREIGLRKSLGAHTSDIVKQFLAESIALCTIGGIFGIIIGYGLSWGLALIIVMVQPDIGNFMPALGLNAILIAVGVCALIGIVFGFYPARRAAKLDPVESLRYQ
ncbi:MAG: ABC transporter permease [Coriobacteriales bacterium]|jgi:putative ABC transport system permease protein|nr:ABC transporter permease [Coriobacteriales bacterium]